MSSSTSSSLQPTHSMGIESSSRNSSSRILTPNTSSTDLRSLLPQEIELPANVDSVDKLQSLPPEVLSGDPLKPLLYTDERGDSYKYYLQPMTYSVIMILLVELLERFSYYGINYTQTLYLTGAYDSHWNADMSAIQASIYVSICTTVAYTMPFAGAFVADLYFGDYATIIVGAGVFYLPGLILIACTTVPGLLGNEFNKTALAWGILVLWPIGTGMVKSVVNVFGAKQFHPILQASMIESYYVNFYICINIGALVGGIIIPVVAQYNVTVAYTIPVLMLTICVTFFLAGTSRYVRTKPQNDLFHPWSQSGQPKPAYPFAKQPLTKGGENFTPWTILKISLLIIPFNIAYSQMATTFIIQGTVMSKLFGIIDAASMNNADAVAVLLFGYVIGTIIYPALAQRNIKIATTYKFALGSALGAAAIAWALLVEFWIHEEYERTGSRVSIAWQSISYILIGAGEIFAVSAAYEVAFTASPPEQKAMASAINLFCVGGIPSIACIALYQLGARWFQNSKGGTNISKIHDYAEAQVYKYFALLLAVSLIGVIVNLLPPVRKWVEMIEEEAANNLRTPVTTPRPTGPTRNKRVGGDDDEESTALLRIKKHQNYLKYGSGPQLYKNNSFRAGVSERMALRNQAQKRKPTKYVKYPHGLSLYKPVKMNGTPVDLLLRTGDEENKSQRLPDKDGLDVESPPGGIPSSSTL